MDSWTDPQFLRFMEALQTYCGTWKSPVVFYHSYFPHEHWINFQFVLRWFKSVSPESEKAEITEPQTGMHCHRESGFLETREGSKVEFREQRLWMFFKVCTNAETRIIDDTNPFKTQLPPCTGFWFCDRGFLRVANHLWWNNSKLMSCQEGSGVALFQLYIMHALDTWETEWTKTLDQVDKLLRVTVCPTTKPPRP